jgi:histidyl-tRNA synthetase
VERPVAGPSRRFAAVKRLFDADPGAFTLVTRLFGIPTRRFAVITRIFIAPTRRFGVVTRRFTMPARRFAIPTRRFAVVTRLFAAPTRRFAVFTRRFTASTRLFTPLHLRFTAPPRRFTAVNAHSTALEPPATGETLRLVSVNRPVTAPKPAAATPARDNPAPFALNATGLSNLRAVKGMNDVLPDEIGQWHRVEQAFARTMTLYGFREVRTPYVEPTPLFVRTVGETTDIVEKEMYSFEHHGEPLTLRPEGTAGAARAYVEHKVHTTEPVTKWWYAGPMFRAERPQRGRYRQFYQLGAEHIGDPGPGSDAEMIDMLVRFFAEIGIHDVQVLVNSLGGGASREAYRAALAAYFEGKRDALSDDSRRRLATNPLRILDSKDPRDQDAVRGAPSLHEHLTDADRDHFRDLRAHLDTLGTPYTVDERLVRGLDYYTRTLFEIKGAHDKLGAGDTLVGGGRYDAMMRDLGGPDVPAIGFAAGLERLVIASEAQTSARVVDAYVAPIGAAAVGVALGLGRDLRRAGVRCEVDARGTSLKSQLRRANALGARVVLVLGDDELAAGAAQVKDLDAHTQETMPREQAVRVVADRLLSAGRP